MRHIGIAVFPNYSVMSFAAVPVFELANFLSGRPIYALHFLSEKGGLVPTSAGMSVQTERFDRRPLDTLIVGGGTVIEPSTPGLIAFLRDALSVTGAWLRFVAAPIRWPKPACSTAGGPRPHWLYVQDMRARFPKVEMDRTAFSSRTVLSGRRRG